MAWEKIEERLKKMLKVEIAFPSGKVWLPDAHLTVDEWLTSVAQTDEELKELDIPRIQFLQNHWPMETLVELEWDRPLDHRSISAMYVGHDAYILFFDGVDYDVIAGISPKDRPQLYRAVVGKLLDNTTFIPRRPRLITNYRPDLLPDLHAEDSEWPAPAEMPGGWPGSSDSMYSTHESSKLGYLSEILVGWVRTWIDLPVLGFWYEENPDSINVERGKYVLNYRTDAARKREKNKVA